MGHIERSIDQMVGAYPLCGGCGSENVLRDAWAKWNRATLEWDLNAIFDNFCCADCQSQVAPIWKIDREFRLKRIRRLNDALRQGRGENISVVITQGVQALGDDVLAVVSRKVSEFDKFTEDNDPRGEHDFGAVDANGETIFWKIDYFDRRLKALSPDEANPAVTSRVMTIMLASEY